MELDDEYSGPELIKAIVRVINRAGEKGASVICVNLTCTTLFWFWQNQNKKFVF